jgi:predicted nucleic acid-binding protein
MNVAPFSSAVPLVIDPSAWSRQSHAHVRDRWKATARAGLLASCPVASLEILGSARNEREFVAVDFILAALPQVPVTESVCRTALAAMHELKGSRRLPAPDYLIAAAAAEHGFGVLHADRHFDRLAAVLQFESVRLPD